MSIIQKISDKKWNAPFQYLPINIKNNHNNENKQNSYKKNQTDNGNFILPHFWL